MNKKTLVVVLEGGLVQWVVSDDPVDDLQVLVIDYDTEGADEEDLLTVRVKNGEGQQNACTSCLIKVEPATIDIQDLLKQVMNRGW